MDQPLVWSKLDAHFADPDTAREYLEYLRWGTAGPTCPHCGRIDPYKIVPKVGSSTRKGLYKCRIKECRKQFTVTVGTVFEDSHLPLNKWLQALYLIGGSKKGMSSHQLHRMLGITYKAAWFMTHRLRYAMSHPSVQRTHAETLSAPPPARFRGHGEGPVADPSPALRDDR